MSYHATGSFNPNLERRARLLQALSDPTRLEILSLLAEKNGTICVDEIVKHMGRLQQPTISHHIRILYDAGVIAKRKHGLNAFYTVNTDKLSEAQMIIEAVRASIEREQEIVV